MSPRKPASASILSSFWFVSLVWCNSEWLSRKLSHLFKLQWDRVILYPVLIGPCTKHFKWARKQVYPVKGFSHIGFAALFSYVIVEFRKSQTFSPLILCKILKVQLFWNGERRFRLPNLISKSESQENELFLRNS